MSLLLQHERVLRDRCGHHAHLHRVHLHHGHHVRLHRGHHVRLHRGHHVRLHRALLQQLQPCELPFQHGTHAFHHLGEIDVGLRKDQM